MPSPLVSLLVGAAFFLLALYLRIRLFLGRVPGGVDTWYYLSYAEELRRTKRWPVRLPQYALDIEEQWYPPGFPLFLAMIPLRLLKKYFWLVSPLVDCIQLAMLYYFTLKNVGDITPAAVAAGIYAITPTLVSENQNLNSRSFGALLNAALMLAFFRYTSYDRPLFWLAVAVVLGALVLLSHKLTTQSFLFTALFLAAVLWDARYLGLVAASAVVAFLLSGGFYLRVLRGHWDILSFWRRHIHNLNAHQILDSPIYGHPAQGSSKKTYQPGLRGAVRVAVRLFGENPFLLAMLVVPVRPDTWPQWMYWWAVAVLILAFITTFWPALRFLGPGFRYMKLTAFPSAYTLALATGPWNPSAPLFIVLLTACAVLSVLALGVLYSYHTQKQTEHTSSVSPAMAEAARYLAALPAGTILCLPVMYADYVAYQTKKKVLWGTHSGGFQKIEDFYPVLAKPLPWFIENYQASYLLLDHAYCDLATLGLSPQAKALASFGSVTVYTLDRSGRPGLGPVEGDGSHYGHTRNADKGAEGGGSAEQGLASHNAEPGRSPAPLYLRPLPADAHHP